MLEYICTKENLQKRNERRMLNIYERSNLTAKTGEGIGIIILIAVVGIGALIYNIKSRKLY